jgi:DNA-binding NarL/FixJ family response regulator
MGLSLDRQFSTEDALGHVTAISSAPSNVTTVRLGTEPVVIVHGRALDRECLVRNIQEHNPALAIAAVASLNELRELRGRTEPSAILLVLGERKVSDPTVRGELQEVVSEFSQVPVVLLADADAPAEILAALDGGARGYIPTSENVKVLIVGIALARAGGIFVPASGISRLRDFIHPKLENAGPADGVLTPRQRSVANALRQGKANKVIAYDLNMCVSTVKVHIRTIMKKLNATNRTEVAYKLHEMFGTAQIK